MFLRNTIDDWTRFHCPCIRGFISCITHHQVHFLCFEVAVLIRHQSKGNCELQIQTFGSSVLKHHIPRNEVRRYDSSLHSFSKTECELCVWRKVNAINLKFLNPCNLHSLLFSISSLFCAHHQCPFKCSRKRNQTLSTEKIKLI